MHRRLACAGYAALCAAAMLGWQALTVHYSYHGNWTALFSTGSKMLAPPAPLRAENVYLFPNGGYDGQAYHYIAHDPFFQRGFASSIDDPALRYRRILVPLLAYLLAAGQDRAVDAAYVLVTDGFCLLGAYWLARLALLHGRPAWFGLFFASVPAVLVSMDRLTVDGALASLCVGFALYEEEQSRGRQLAILACAPLVRETGILVIAADFLFRLFRRQYQDAAITASMAIPALGWWIFAGAHTGWRSEGFLSETPLSGFWTRLAHPYPYAIGPLLSPIASVLDILALAGIAGALAWALWRGIRRAWTPVAIAVYLFALLAIMLAKADAWAEVYAFARTLTPLLLFAALDGLALDSLLPATAMLAADPRILMQMGGQVLNVARGLWPGG